MARAGRLSGAAAIVAVIITVLATSTGVAAPERVSQGASAPAWKIGECFASATVEDVAVDLTSEVACSEDHAIQIVGGADLPRSLASKGRDALLSSGSTLEELEALAGKTCAPTKVVGNIYSKKQAKTLARLFRQHDIFEWMVPASGGFSILLPDAASFAAGTKAVLCVYVPDGSFSGSTAGDIRDIGTDAPLDALRRCYNRDPGSGTDFASCADTHDLQQLVSLVLDVRGLPVDVGDWPDSAWGEFDAICRDFGEALVGANRKDLAFRSNTDGDVAPIDGTRFMWCETYPVDEDAAMPGGVSVVGLGTADLEFAKDPDPAR